mmetsp:Transcript_9077/g.28559  ORF Transcript_9077/g.28559 Transcript_9077/m.28559 type:complete len:318 (+) Transcript_9077:1261-2214(+)
MSKSFIDTLCATPVALVLAPPLPAGSSTVSTSQQTDSLLRGSLRTFSHRAMMAGERLDHLAASSINACSCRSRSCSMCFAAEEGDALPPMTRIEATSDRSCCSLRSVPICERRSSTAICSCVCRAPSTTTVRLSPESTSRSRSWHEARAEHCTTCAMISALGTCWSHTLHTAKAELGASVPCGSASSVSPDVECTSDCTGSCSASLSRSAAAFAKTCASICATVCSLSVVKPSRPAIVSRCALSARSSSWPVPASSCLPACCLSVRSSAGTCRTSTCRCRRRHTYCHKFLSSRMRIGLKRKTSAPCATHCSTSPLLS